MIKSEAGLSIIELLISVLILGVFMSLFVGFQTDYIKRFANVTQDTGENAIIRMIQEDILKDQRHIVPQTSLASLDAAILSDAALANSFASAQTERRCYDKNGSRLEPAPAATQCPFNVTYYRVMVKDRRYPANSIYAKVPVSRINFKIEFKKIKDKTTESQTIYISKLLTNVLLY